MKLEFLLPDAPVNANRGISQRFLLYRQTALSINRRTLPAASTSGFCGAVPSRVQVKASGMESFFCDTNASKASRLAGSMAGAS